MDTNRSSLKEEKRLRWYQKLSATHDSKELHKLANQLSPINESPEEYKNLIYLLELKILAQRSNVTSIDTTVVTSSGEKARKRIVFRLAQPLTHKQIEQLLNISDQWSLSEFIVKIDFEALSNDWLKDVKKCVNIL